LLRHAVWIALLLAASFAVGGSPSSRPLDLPSGGRGVAEDEEETPESIQFFGSIYEGDGFFFLLDKSGSMYGTKMAVLQSEVMSSLAELSEPSEFGIVAFSGDVQAYSTAPTPASSIAVSTAQSWVEGLVPYGPTHMLGGAAQILTISQLSTRASRSVISVGDGLPNGPGPEQTLAGILLLNTEDLPFHTILIGAGDGAAQFMSDLANLTGGTFRCVEL